MPFITVTVDMNDLTGPKSPLSLLLNNQETILRGGGSVAARAIRNYYRSDLSTRHTTASRLGASPSNHYKASDVGQPMVDGNEVAIPISTPGMSRAFNDLDIRPVEARALAIPLHRDAYGLQPRELSDRGVRLFRILRRGERQGGQLTDVLYRQGDNDALEAMYRLVGAVRQPRDRTLLPSDEQLTTAFTRGAKKAIKVVLQMNAAGIR